MDQNQANWVAGLLEGEGCFSLIAKVTNAPDRKTLVVSCTSTDLDVLERLIALTGIGSPYKDKLKPGHKQAWTWRVGNRREVVDLLNQISPLMGSRRGLRIQEMLEWHEANPPLREEKGSVAQHGTRRKYSKGCRCAPCRKAESTYRSDYLRRKNAKAVVA